MYVLKFPAQAIDVWTGVCLTFVFGALLEFALVNYATRSDQHRQRIKEQIKKWDLERQQTAASHMAQNQALDHSEEGIAMVFRIYSTYTCKFLLIG